MQDTGVLELDCAGGRMALLRDGDLPAQDRKREQDARVKDVATIEGIRDNQLVGYGLVVGLQGHGRQLADGVSGADAGFGACSAWASPCRRPDRTAPATCR